MLSMAKSPCGRVDERPTPSWLQSPEEGRGCSRNILCDAMKGSQLYGNTQVANLRPSHT